MKICRKSSLKGIAGLSLFPFLDINSETKTKPKFKRMVFVSNPFGMIPQYFKPKMSGRDYVAPQVLKTIDHLRNDFTVFSNLEHLDAGNGHHNVHAYLSGINRKQTQGHPNKNQTIDQLAGEYVGNLSRYPVLNLGVKGECEQMSWSRNGIHIRPQTNEKLIYQNLFIDGSLESKKAKHKVVNNKLNLIDVLHQQTKVYQTKLGKQDLSKLEEYKVAIHELDQKINMEKSWIDISKPKTDFKEPQSRDFSELYPSFLEMSFWALYNNQTRVLSLEIGKNVDPSSIDSSGGYHSNSHHGQSDSKLENMAKIETFFLKEFGVFIEKLKNTPDPEGSGSMLDNTMVLFGSGMSNSSKHSNRDLPILLAGGGFNHGRHIKYQQATPMTNLLLTMGKHFGLPIDSFNKSTGTLEV